MTASTTIKVPRELRDRIAARAAREGTTLAQAIAHALDTSEEEQFWAAVAEQNRRSPDSPDDQVLPDGPQGDHLEPSDDRVGRDGW